MSAPAPTGALYLFADSDANQIGFLALDGSGNPLVVTNGGLAPGVHSIYSKYGGDGVYPHATSNPISYEITSLHPQVTITVTASPDSPQPQGTQITFTVTIVGTE